MSLRAKLFDTRPFEALSITRPNRRPQQLQRHNDGRVSACVQECMRACVRVASVRVCACVHACLWLWV